MRRTPFNRRGRGARIEVAPLSERYSPILHRTFDSKAEMKYAHCLYAQEQAGEIRDLQFQVTTRLCKGITLRIDFKYWDEHIDEWVWDEYKGFPTDMWKLKRNVWAGGLGPGLLRVTKWANKVVGYTHTDIWPGRKEQQ